MEIRPDGQFLQWLREAGIGPHPEYPDSGELVFTRVPDISRFWLPSDVPNDLPNFLLTAAQTASGDGACWLYRRGGGSWYQGTKASSREEVIDRMLGAAGVPANARGALKFESADWQQLLLVMLAFYTLGRHVANDLHLIPDNRSHVVMLGHHGELSCWCPDQSLLDAFIGAMATGGFGLPDHVPDATFKIPEWMASGESGAA
jgi:hypothetical protein